MTPRRTCSALREAAAFGSLVLALLACAGPEQGRETLAPGDPVLFASYVQPYLELRCASLDCHGDPGRPLRLYSELGLRQTDALRSAPISDARDPEPITELELLENRRAFAGIATASSRAQEHLALLKPLALSEGGIEHEGRTHWASRQDPGYRCLLGYLVGGAADDVPGECARAIAAEAR